MSRLLSACFIFNRIIKYYGKPGFTDLARAENDDHIKCASKFPVSFEISSSGSFHQGSLAAHGIIPAFLNFLVSGCTGVLQISPDPDKPGVFSVSI